MPIEIDPKILEWAKTDPFARKYINKPILLLKAYRDAKVVTSVAELEEGMKCELDITVISCAERIIEWCIGGNHGVNNCRCSGGSPGSTPKTSREYVIFDMHYDGNVEEDGVATASVGPWLDGKVPEMVYGNTYKIKGKYVKNTWNDMETFKIQVESIKQIDDIEPTSDVSEPEPIKLEEPVKETRNEKTCTCTANKNDPNCRVHPEKLPDSDELEEQRTEQTPYKQAIKDIKERLEMMGFITDDFYKAMTQNLTDKTTRKLKMELELHQRGNKWFSEIYG